MLQKNKLNYNNLTKVQVVVYSDNAISVETLLATEDEKLLIATIINWLRGNTHSDFNITKHNNTVSWNIVHKDRKENFSTIKNEV